MEIKETLSKTNLQSYTSEDIEYYKYIFKKTEKIVCAIFYVLRSNINQGHDDNVVRDIEDIARTTLDTSLQSLKSITLSLDKYAVTLRYTLIALESKLRVAHAARFLDGELLDVFLHEIDSLQRSLKKYTVSNVKNPLYAQESMGGYIRTHNQTKTRSITKNEGLASDTTEKVQPRRERICGVLRDKGEATIKDIIDVVTDCSEKTVQRELINLIKDNIVIREGERRWSKYKLV